MKAKEMRKLTDLVNQQRGSRKKEIANMAEVTRLKAAEYNKRWWLSIGIPRLLEQIKMAAQDGNSFYEEVIDECPDYVVDSLRDKGFEVERTSAKRGVRLGRGDGDSWDRYYAHVLLIRW